MNQSFGLIKLRRRKKKGAKNLRKSLDEFWCRSVFSEAWDFNSGKNWSSCIPPRSGGLCYFILDYLASQLLLRLPNWKWKRGIPVLLTRSEERGSTDADEGAQEPEQEREGKGEDIGCMAQLNWTNPIEVTRRLSLSMKLASSYKESRVIFLTRVDEAE